MKALSSKVGRGGVFAVGIAAAALVGSAVAIGVVGRGEPDAGLSSPTRTVAPGLVRLDAAEGKRLLFESEAHTAFLPLISHFETQMSLTHCGPAAMAMVLNALEIPAPIATGYGSYRLFTQENVLNDLTDPIVSAWAVSRRGMSLATLARALAVYDVSVDMHYADASSIDAFRMLAAEYLGSPSGHVIVNYSRTALGQEGLGHISPLGAYDADSDRFLILDVSRYKAPPVWVTTEQLFEAMAEPVSPDSMRTRGFLLIRAPADADGHDAPVATPPT